MVVAKIGSTMKRMKALPFNPATLVEIDLFLGLLYVDGSLVGSVVPRGIPSLHQQGYISAEDVEYLDTASTRTIGGVNKR